MAEESNIPGTNKELHDWAVALVEDGEGRRNAMEGLWWENLATYVGDFWVEWDPHRRKLNEPVKKPLHRVRIPINLAQPVVRTEVAKLTKNRPITDVVPKGNDLKSINSAKVGDKMLNRYAEKKFHLPKQRRGMLNWAMICGTAGLFVDFDESAEEGIEVYEIDGKPVFDQRIIKAYKQREKKKKKLRRKLKKGSMPQGELVVKPVSPMGLIWDFSALEPEDAWWLIVTEVYDVEMVKKRWGVRPQADPDAEPGVIERRLLQRFDLTQKLTPTKPKAQELCKVHRLYVKPGHPYFPNGLHFAFTKDEQVEIEDFPFEHGELPVSIMGHVPLPTSQYDMSVLQQVKPPVLELSKTLSQMLENRNMASNPPWLEPLQCRVEGDIPNKPGLRIKYNHVPNVPPPQPVQMPDLPQYVKDLPSGLRELIQDISGQGETSQGRVPAGARSGVAIAYLQEEDDTRLGPTVTAFEETMERVNWQILEVIAEKYTIPRTITIFRKHGDPEVFDFYGEMLSGVAGVEVQAGSALPRSKAAKQQFILDLWDRRLEQDPRRVRAMLELSEGEPDEWERDMEQAERENRKLEKAVDVAIEEWHNHSAHLYKHYQYMKSADFEELGEEAQQAFRNHTEEHEVVLKTQQREVASMTEEGALGEGEAPAANGQQVPEGAPPQFSSERSPRSLMGDEPA